MTPEPADTASIAMWAVAGYLTLATLFVLALVWAERMLLVDFAYPIDSDRKYTREGIVSLVGVYILGGWLFAYASVGLTFPGATPATTSVALSLIGILLMGVLRLQALSRSFSLGRFISEPPTLSLVALVLLCVMLAVAFFVTALGNVSPHIEDIAPVRAPAFVNPQPHSVILLIGALVVAGIIEAIWAYATHTDSLKRVADSAARTAVDSIAGHISGQTALRLYGRIGDSAASVDIHWVAREIKGFTSVQSSIPAAKTIAEALVTYGLLIPVASGSYRRNPHYHSFHRRIVCEYLEARRRSEAITEQQIEELLLLRERIVDTNVPSWLGAYVLATDKMSSQAVKDLLEATMNELEEARLTARSRLLVSYLKMRYWEQMAVRDIAQELAYSREHVSRTIHTEALALYRGFLAQRLVRSITRTQLGFPEANLVSSRLHGARI